MRRIALTICMAIAFALSNVSQAEDHTQTIQSLLAEARDAQSRRDFDSAASSYRKAVELEPSVPELWANLGLMYHESGKSAEAIESFKTAARLNASLFVPQLFLGIEYLGSKNPNAALPFLETAVKIKPDDLQAALSLGKANAMLDHGDRAADSYIRATLLAPNDTNAWLGLGTAYLQQVENDARVMTSTYSHTGYVTLRAAETLAEEGKLIQAVDAYKAAIASSSPIGCTHAQYGITLLRQKKVAEAREQFELEAKAASHCGLALLGMAMADLAEGHPGIALKGLTSIATADPGFVRSNLSLFRDAVSSDQVRQLISLARAQQNTGANSIDVGSLIEKAFLSDETPVISSSLGQPQKIQAPLAVNAEKLHAAGQYAKCSEALEAAVQTIGPSQLQLLASCSFYTGDFRITSMAARRLRTNPATRVQGLYWESKADQKLAIVALSRAGEIDADSPRMHVLLGDVFRQKRRWDDAETEYRKAVALDPRSRSARLSLAIVLFTELKTDEALEIDKSLLAEAPDDPEANLLVGEIFVQRNLFAEAEPYLSRCRDLKPEFVPRLHALLGKVYAETDRIPAAISEYKLGLSTDEDGSIHYQLARLYQKSGDKGAAEQAFRESKRLADRRNDSARIALEQSSTDVSRR